MRPRFVAAILLLAVQFFSWATPAWAAASTLASYTWMADGAKYASARANGTGYVYKGALVFERNAAGKLSLDAALTNGGRITAQKDASNRWRYSEKEEQAAALNPALPLGDDPRDPSWIKKGFL